MKTIIARAVAAVAAAGFAGSAAAHVGYGSSLFTGNGAYDPIANVIGTGSYGAAANFSASVSSNGGFLAGLDSGTLGNTHDIRFRYFVLSETSQVSFTINGLANSTVSGNANAYLNGKTASTLNPAFSLYSGVVPASSHDGVGDIPSIAAAPATSAYLATAPQFASWSPFVAVNAVRGGAAAGTAGNPTGLWGVFDSNGNWSTGNNGQWTATNTSATDPIPANGTGPYLGSQGVPKVAGIEYLGISGADAAGGATFIDSLGVTQAIAGADGLVDNKVSWSGVLQAGVYTLAIGGANLNDFARLFSDVRLSSGGLNATAGCVLSTCANLYAEDRLARSLSITGFSVTAVPEPGTWAMMLAGLLLVGAVARRRWNPIG
jgi:hypothetical protein